MRPAETTSSAISQPTTPPARLVIGEAPPHIRRIHDARHRGIVTGRYEEEGARARAALSGLRIVVALFLVVHGVARISLGIVDDFGVFLSRVGLPVGQAVALGVTAFELIGGALLAAGRFTRVVALAFVTELLAGIVLVHAPQGWFVVGAGRNGMEYSVLLIGVLLAVVWAGDTDGDAPASQP